MKFALSVLMWVVMVTTVTADSIQISGTGQIVGNVILTISIGSITNPVNSTNIWVNAYGGTGSDSGLAVATDSSSNVFLAGYFSGTANFGQGNVTSAGGTDIVIAKYNFGGTNLWVKTFGGTGDDQPNGIAIDSSGNVFVTGQFSSTVNFGTGPLVSAGGLDVFALKLNSSGASQWAVRTGSLGEDMGSAIGVNASAVYITGHFQGTNNFGGGNITSTFSGLGAANVMDTFVWKLDPSTGAFTWVRKMNNTSQNRAWGLALDSDGNVTVGGSYQGSIDWKGGFTNFITSAGSYDIFAAKVYSTNGFAWLKGIGGIDTEEAFGAAADPITKDIVLTGYYRGTVNFGGGNVTAAGSDDIFVLKLLGTDGSYSWVKTAGAFDSDRGLAVAVDASGNVLATGRFSTTGANFGGPPLVSAGLFDGYLVKYTSAGVWTWSERFGGTGNDLGFGVSTDSTGYVLNTGSFSGSFIFATIPVSASGPSDAFLWRHIP